MNICKIIRAIFNLELYKSLGFNYKVDSKVSHLLNVCLKSGIVDYEDINKHHGIVEFGNGVKYGFWRVNTFYAWLRCGIFYKGEETYTFHFKDITLMENIDVIYSYDYGRPSLVVMGDFFSALKKYLTNLPKPANIQYDSESDSDNM